MSITEPKFTTKLAWNMPWLVRYPLARLRSLLERTAFEKKHIIITVADHFEPGWSENGVLDHSSQMKRLERYHHLASETGNAVCDVDGTKFRHTNFYPAEQYHRDILNVMAEMQNDGLGEVEVHLHHGVEAPDTSANLRRSLIEFRDKLANEHGCLSRIDGVGHPVYAFVHGNLALANSCGGRFCGVDDEMAILRETGCYADMTLPSAPDQSQVGVINQIYEYAGRADQAAPHSAGRRLSAGGTPQNLPLIMEGPLVFNWSRRVRGIPVPRIDDGALTASQGLDFDRFRRWTSANVTVAGRSDWIFVKLYCHGFFDADQSYCIGDEAKRFMGELVNYGESTGKYSIHFASAREMFNIAIAAAEGHQGNPNVFRDHKVRSIMATAATPARAAA